MSSRQGHRYHLRSLHRLRRMRRFVQLINTGHAVREREPKCESHCARRNLLAVTDDALARLHVLPVLGVVYFTANGHLLLTIVSDIQIKQITTETDVQRSH